VEDADWKQAVVTVSQQPIEPDAVRHPQSLSAAHVAGGHAPLPPSVVAPLSGVIGVPVSPPVGVPVSGVGGVPVSTTVDTASGVPLGPVSPVLTEASGETMAPSGS
jgi:hypothetical protein